ncbi:MAG TPA: hypothetical protein VIN59_09120 [Alphaproteobacteria bacterium]
MMSFFSKKSGRAGLLALSLTLILSMGMLTACGDTKTTMSAVEQQKSELDSALQQATPKGHLAQELEIDSRPYYGSVAKPITNGEVLPPQFEQPGAVVMTFARPVSLSEFTRMVQSVTGVRTNSASITGTAASSGSSEGSTTFVPTGGEQVSGGRVVWQGRLSDLLNEASDTFGADWSYDGDTITFAQEVTRTFMLHALAGDLSLSGSVASGTGGAGNLPRVTLNADTGSIKIWEDIKAAVTTIMGDGGTAAFSQSTGTITVTGAPQVVRRVETYLNQQNSMRLRRVAIGVKVIKVDLDNTTAYDVDITGIVKRAFGEAGLQLSTATLGEAATPGLAFTVSKNKTVAGVSAFDSDQLIGALRAAKGISNASVVHSGALMTLSDQPAPLQVGNQRSYLARTSTTTGDSGSTSLEPGTFDVGLMMTVLPRIVESNKILMRVSLSITSLDNMFSAGPTGNQIQLPDLATTGFMQNAVLTSGETMVLAGFERDENNIEDEGGPGPLAVLQKRYENSRARTATVLLLTAEILPEEPMSVIGQ